MRVIATVARFYGFGDGDIQRMPVRRLFAYARYVPEIEAKESLLWSERLAVPWMEKDDRRKVLTQWQKLAEGRDRVADASRVAASYPGARRGDEHPSAD